MRNNKFLNVTRACFVDIRLVWLTDTSGFAGKKSLQVKFVGTPRSIVKR
jgi:hypothetical protein